MITYLKSRRMTLDDCKADTYVVHDRRGEIIMIYTFSESISGFVPLRMAEWRTHQPTEKLIELCQEAVDEVVSNLTAFDCDGDMMTLAKLAGD